MLCFFRNFFSKYPSSFGFIALCVWSFSALFASIMKSIPTFEMLSMIFFVSFISIFIKIGWFNDWKKLKQPLFVSLIGVVGISGNDYFYFEAFKHAPASQVDIINYLWPIFVVFFSPFLTNKKIKFVHILGCIMSFLGIYVLISYDSNMHFKPSYLVGYFYALCDAIIWAFYVLMCMRYRQFNSEMVGVYCGIGMVLALIAHFFANETFVVPSFSQVSVIIALGVFSQGMAYVFWEVGIKKGNSLLLSTSSYFTPLFSIALLILFSKAAYSHSLLVATILVTAGALIANKN